MTQCKYFLTSLKLLFVFCALVQNINAQTLKEVYKDAFLIGVAVNPAITSGDDKASQDIAIKQFKAIAVENVMKATFINPKPSV